MALSGISVYFLLTSLHQWYENVLKFLLDNDF